MSSKPEYYSSSFSSYFSSYSHSSYPPFCSSVCAFLWSCVQQLITWFQIACVYIQSLPVFLRWFEGFLVIFLLWNTFVRGNSKKGNSKNGAEIHWHPLGRAEGAEGKGMLKFGRPPHGEEGQKRDWLFGASISLSGGGSMLAVGAPNYEGSGKSGFVRIFALDDDGKNWVQIGEDLTLGHPDDGLGTTVVLSADGNTLAVSSPTYNERGSVQAFEIERNSDGGRWFPKGNTLSGTVSQRKYSYGNGDRDLFGSKLALSWHGKTLAASKWGDPDDAIAIFDYDGSSDHWGQSGHDIPIHSNHWHGASVAVASHHTKTTIVAVGYSFADQAKGHVTVMHRSGEGDNIVWKAMGQTLHGNGKWDKFGSMVGLSADGMSMVVGTDGGHYALVYSYDNNSDRWVLHAPRFEMVYGDAVLSSNGLVLAVLVDGRTVQTHKRHPRKYVWTPFGQPIQVDFKVWDISLSLDGAVIAVSDADSDQVAVYSVHE